MQRYHAYVMTDYNTGPRNAAIEYYRCEDVDPLLAAARAFKAVDAEYEQLGPFAGLPGLFERVMETKAALFTLVAEILDGD